MTGVRVVGYTDWYAVRQHGNEYTAYPDGTVEKTGEHLGADESIWGWFTSDFDGGVRISGPDTDPPFKD